MAESPSTYVKIAEDGQYLEREVGPREIDAINLLARGFVLKGSRGAPKPSDGVVPAPADSNTLPTSIVPADVPAASKAPKS